MRNPLPSSRELLLIAAGGALGAAVLWLHAERTRAADAAIADARYHAADARAKAWQSFYRADAARVDTIADTVTREVARVRVDTVWRHDTLHVAGDTVQRTLVPTSSLGRMDAALRSCGHLAASVVPLRTDCDSLVAAANDRTAAVQEKFAAVRPRWYDRCGVSGGLAAIRDGTVVRAGPAIMVGCRVFP